MSSDLDINLAMCVPSRITCKISSLHTSPPRFQRAHGFPKPDRANICWKPSASRQQGGEWPCADSRDEGRLRRGRIGRSASIRTRSGAGDGASPKEAPKSARFKESADSDKMECWAGHIVVGA